MHKDFLKNQKIMSFVLDCIVTNFRKFLLFLLSEVQKSLCHSVNIQRQFASGEQDLKSFH